VEELEDLSRGSESMLDRLEGKLHGVVSFVIVPAFALANSGLGLNGDLARAAVTSSVTLGIVLGLIAGKTIGICGLAWLAVRLRLSELPEGTTWRHILGVGLLGGIGFTVSLFIAGLAFADEGQIEQAKAGILVASVLAGLAAYTFLRVGATAGAAQGPEREATDKTAASEARLKPAGSSQ
jgi:NhaA family Na+:H+ antiporter